MRPIRSHQLAVCICVSQRRVAGEDEGVESEEEFGEEEVSKPVAAKGAKSRAERMVRPRMSNAQPRCAGLGLGALYSRCSQVKCES